MTEVIGRMYTLDDFQSILFKSEAALLPKELTDLLVHLESQLDIVAEGPAAVVQEVRPNHRKAPSYRGGKGHPNNKHNKKEEDWEAVRSFKATKIEVKVGIEKTVNDLRVVLNKMSTANYEKQKDALLAILDLYFESEEIKSEETSRISKAIFDIASTNKFYSEIYAKLYAELSNKYEVFRDLLADFVALFSQNVGAISYVDPDVDYDGYCAYTKVCDMRKATTTFLVNCLKRGLIEKEKVFRLVEDNLAFIHQWMVEPDKTKEVEEIVENMFILIGQTRGELDINAVLEKVRTLAKTKGKTHVSWSNRAAFKMMDLVELL